MKVLLFNGSCREKGCTFTALNIIAEVLNAEGVETEILQIGNKPVRDCIGCNGCVGKGKCVFNDDFVNEWIEKSAAADGFVFGSPVYFAHPDGRLLSVMDRMFYAGGKSFEQKPGAVIVSARRAGTTASLDAISKHLSIRQMPVISSTYWNMVHGNTPDEVLQDKEGVQTMRNLGKNLAWILKCIEAGKKEGITPPVAEKADKTNFIR
ncbi:MAG: flavodoxin family protein [Clostridiales bacterium]|nr:flavodoxin family protein [Clostridiales bacterium]